MKKVEPHIPDPLPLADLDHKRLFPIVGKVNAALARYDGLLQATPNTSVMLSPLATREAVLSSKIEGTRATMDDVLEHEAGLKKEGETYKDVQEIINYRVALSNATTYLQDSPIRLSMICDLHKTLMDSVRGQNLSPGEFRQDQNWIGPPGSSIEEATFVPPSPKVMMDGLREWERYMMEDDIDFLLQTAVVHAQFELLHPFRDGNGRIGRILIPLFLFQKNVLSQPTFYLSEYLEANRSEYYARLNAISAHRDWEGWITFFLLAVAEQSLSNVRRVQRIKNLYDEMKDRIQVATRSQHTMHLLDAIFARPIFSASDFARRLNEGRSIHVKTTGALLRKLRDAGILEEVSPQSGSRAATLAFPKLLDVAENGAEA